MMGSRSRRTPCSCALSPDGYPAILDGVTENQTPIEAINARLAALRAEPEYAMKTTTGIGIRRAELELEELLADLTALTPDQCDGEFDPDTLTVVPPMTLAEAAAYFASLTGDDCPICHGAYTIAVAGPDENGQYDVDDCPCQVTR